MRSFFTARVPGPDDLALQVRQSPTDIHTAGFAKAVTNGVDPDILNEMCVGAGMTRNQVGGNLVVTCGTTANEEFLARSLVSVRGAFSLVVSEAQSQRIANTNIGVWLADLIGTGLSMVVNSSTSVTVSAVPGVWSAGNVGQSMNISCPSLAGCIPGRWAIASVANITATQADLTFTVAGWPGSGSGTVSLWGWNAFKMVANNATVTNMSFTSYRKGYGLADTQATVSTYASGHMYQVINDGTLATLGDSAQGSQTGNFSARGSRMQGIPDQDVELYVFLQALNGTTGPLSSTTWTFDKCSLEDIPNNKLFVAQSTRTAFNFATLTAVAVTSQPTISTSSNGVSTFHHLISANSTNATSVKSSAGGLALIAVSNNGASVAYFKLYNKASSPTVGTDTPIHTQLVPAGGHAIIPEHIYRRLGTGVAYALTTGMAVADTGAVASAQMSVHIAYA